MTSSLTLDPHPPIASERRTFLGRRARDRRKPGNRINKEAPRQSVMKRLGAFLTAMTGAVFALVFVAGELLLDATPVAGLLFIGSTVVVSAFTLMLGCIEQRLIEIRLEIMIGNGGMRQSDRRGADRRAGGDEAGFSRRSADAA